MSHTFNEDTLIAIANTTVILVEEKNGTETEENAYVGALCYYAGIHRSMRMIFLRVNYGQRIHVCILHLFICKFWLHAVW